MANDNSDRSSGKPHSGPADAPGTVPAERPGQLLGAADSIAHADETRSGEAPPVALPASANQLRPVLRDAFLIMVSVVVILAAAREASSLLVPFLLALFIAVICGAPISALRQRGLPGWAAASTVGAVVLFAFTLLVVILGRSTGAFLDELPVYELQFEELVDSWLAQLTAQGIEVDPSVFETLLDPADAIAFVGNFLSGLGEVLTNFVLILFTVIFILADASNFPHKLATGQDRSYHRYLNAFQDLVRAMNDYIVTKGLVSALTGALIWLGLVALDVKFALLWGFLAFLLNFIPNVGSVVAAAPAVLLSLLEKDPLLTGTMVLLYVGVNTIVGNAIEPRWMGQKVGLSTLTVFLSLVFWGWMFGPVGMFLSVPLTMAIKFLAMQNPGTLWLSVLLSSAPVPNEKKSAEAAVESTGAG